MLTLIIEIRRVIEMVKVTFNQDPITLEGEQLEVNDTAPSFRVVANDMSEKTEKDFAEKLTIISVVPSIDTGVCSTQTKKFNEKAKELANVNLLTVSMDLPFAQARWTNEEDVKSMTMLSDYRYRDFGKNYGVLIKELGLLTRSVFIVDSNNKIQYVEYVSEATNEPDYDAALEKLKELAE